MTLRSRLAHVGACLLLLLALAPAASASPALPAPRETYSTQQTGPCTDEFVGPFTSNYFQAQVEDGGAARMRGVRAYIDPRELTFRPCSHGDFVGPGTHDGVFAWIGLEPGAAAPASNKPGIMQVGIARCNQLGTNVCDGSLHFFLGRSGCGYGVHVTDLGPASYDEHHFEISSSPDYNDWYIRIDGFTKFTVEDGGTSSDRLSCWVDEDTRAEWAVETWDGGDGIASADDKLNIRGASYMWSNTLGFVGTSWNASDTCDRNRDSDQLNYSCDIINQRDIALWSTRW